MNNKLTVALVAAITIPTSLIWFEKRPAPIAVKSVPGVIAGAAQPPAVVETVATVIAPVPQPVALQTPVVDTVSSNGTIKHIAQPGETVTSLAADLLGKDTKTNREAIINANTSLKADPDKLEAGRSYHIPVAPAVAVEAAVPNGSDPIVAKPTAAKLEPKGVESASTPVQNEMRYTAREGDTVSTLAAALLGSSDQAHQNMMLNANPSLLANPDRVITGQTYRIEAPAGLSAVAESPSIAVTPRPLTQPDSDTIVAAGAPRILRYTAKDGDTVTTLAIELLGSNTQAARDTIINNNPSLKQDPDSLVAGRVYLIAAPVASAPQ